MVSFSCTVLVILPRLTSFSVLEFEIIHQSCHHNTQKRLRLCSWTKYVTHRILLCLDLYSVRPLFAWGCLWIFLWKRKAIFFSFIYLLLLILKMSSKKSQKFVWKNVFLLHFTSSRYMRSSHLPLWFLFFSSTSSFYLSVSQIFFVMSKVFYSSVYI